MSQFCLDDVMDLDKYALIQDKINKASHLIDLKQDIL